MFVPNSCERLLLRIRTRHSITNFYLLQNLYFKSISQISESQHPPPSPSSITEDYLINSCGLSPEKAVSAAKQIHTRFQTEDKPNSVLNFFETNGFSKTHITKFISSYPRLLFANVERTLKPKIKLFQDLGLSVPKLTELIALNPYILVTGVKSRMIPGIEFIRSFVQTDENVIKTLKRSKFLLRSNPETRMYPNIALLQEHNVPNSRIGYLIMTRPGFLMVNTQGLKEIVDTIETLGFKPESAMFTVAIHAMSSMSKSTRDTKLKLLKSLGWSEEQIFDAFRRKPLFLACSEKKVRQLMDFFTKKLNWDASVISKYPILLMYSLEVRIIPRYEVCKILMSKGLIREDRELISMVWLSEKDFLKKYVAKYEDELPHLFEAYKGFCNLKMVDQQ